MKEICKKETCGSIGGIQEGKFADDWWEPATDNPKSCSEGYIGDEFHWPVNSFSRRTRGSRKEGSRTVQVVAPSGQSAQNRVKGKEELKARRGGLREGHSMNGDNYILEW